MWKHSSLLQNSIICRRSRLCMNGLPKWKHYRPSLIEINPQWWGLGYSVLFKMSHVTQVMTMVMIPSDQSVVLLAQHWTKWYPIKYNVLCIFKSQNKRGSSQVIPFGGNATKKQAGETVSISCLQCPHGCTQNYQWFRRKLSSDVFFSLFLTGLEQWYPWNSESHEMICLCVTFVIMCHSTSF